MCVKWNSQEIEKWKETATKEQQTYCGLFCNDRYTTYKLSDPDDYINLKKRIGFAIFGFPEEKPDTLLNGDTGYTYKRLKRINEVFDVILECKKKHKNQEDVLVSFIFVCGKVNNDCISIPVIRICEYVSSDKENTIFIDACPRVYKSWQDYLKCNRLPALILCYPKNGVYSTMDGHVEVEFGISPAGKAGAKVIQGFDIGGAVVGLAATGIGVATLFVPVTWPVILG